MSEINPGSIDKAPLFQLLTEIVMEGPVKIGGAIFQAANAVAEGTVNAFHSVKETALGAMARQTPNGPEITPVKELSGPAVAVEPSRDVCHVDPVELGQFSAPSFGNCSRGGAGIGV